MHEFEHERHTEELTFKRCPYCYTYLRLDAKHCVECRSKVGKVDKFGLAKKPISYKAYLASLLWVILLVIYIWKVFIERVVSDGG